MHSVSIRRELSEIAMAREKETRVRGALLEAVVAEAIDK